MFQMFRKKKTFVRILDVPNKMYIEPALISVPLPDGKLMLIFGNFEHISDEMANLIVQQNKDRIGIPPQHVCH